MNIINFEVEINYQAFSGNYFIQNMIKLHVWVFSKKLKFKNFGKTINKIEKKK